jgi:hypothetical protein
MRNRRDTGYKDKHGTPIHEGDRIRWAGDGGEYIITFSQVEQEWILKDDRPDYDCPSLEGISSPLMSRIEIISPLHSA